MSGLNLWIISYHPFLLAFIIDIIAYLQSPSLQYLNLRYTSLSDRAVPVLARTLRSQPSLTILHLENVSLAGRNLILVG